MKRQLLFLVLAGGLALMTAPNASAGKPATVPGYCGNNYAMLMTGYEPNQLPASGSGALIGPGGFNGALTAIVGIGVIQFSSDCSTISGELIYNDGDLQFFENGNVAGVSAGPAACYTAEQETILTFGGLPCFDGGNHFTGGSVTTAGEPPGLSLLQFTANFGFYDFNLEPSTPLPLAFNIQETNGDTTLVGNTVPSPTAPVLTLTMQQQTSSPVPTTFGNAPYVGNDAITCTGNGANEDDIIVAVQILLGSETVAGSYGTAVGSVNIGLNGQASGLLSFNSNDNLLVSGATGTPPNNSDCAFSEQLDPFDGPAAFADGTSNLVTTITSPASDPACTNAAMAPPAGFTTSQVAWGNPSNQNAYATVTGLSDSSFPFVPPGEMSTCIHLFDGPKANGNQNNGGHSS
ncbi:MAG: hypothetical protein WBQ86_00910 [Candidatus Binatus sp.]